MFIKKLISRFSSFFKSIFSKLSSFIRAAYRKIRSLFLVEKDLSFTLGVIELPPIPPPPEPEPPVQSKVNPILVDLLTPYLQDGVEELSSADIMAIAAKHIAAGGDINDLLSFT